MLLGTKKLLRLLKNKNIFKTSKWSRLVTSIWMLETYSLTGYNKPIKIILDLPKILAHLSNNNITYF